MGLGLSSPFLEEIQKAVAISSIKSFLKNRKAASQSLSFVKNKKAPIHVWGMGHGGHGDRPRARTMAKVRIEPKRERDTKQLREADHIGLRQAARAHSEKCGRDSKR